MRFPAPGSGRGFFMLVIAGAVRIGQLFRRS